MVQMVQISGNEHRWLHCRLLTEHANRLKIQIEHVEAHTIFSRNTQELPAEAAQPNDNVVGTSSPSRRDVHAHVRLQEITGRKATRAVIH